MSQLTVDGNRPIYRGKHGRLQQLRASGEQQRRSSALFPGDWVEVRSANEIHATLDASGALDGLPFMPEMLPYCGGRFRVSRRADKTCAVSAVTAIRRMERTVHLEGLRCTGVGHGGCQAGCLLFWKEAWLRPVEGPAPEASTNGAERAVHQLDLPTSTSSRNGDTVFRCQATELWRASCPLAWWKPGQYARDVRTNGVSVAQLARGLALAAREKGRKLVRRVLGMDSSNGRTPATMLELRPGELVEVKSRSEIRATLDAHGHNRGLWWDPEMDQHCGRRYRVLRRVERVIDEANGQMRTIKHPAVILEDVYCTGLYHRFCSRSNYVYWREIWLRRVEETQSEDPLPTQRSEQLDYAASARL